MSAAAAAADAPAPKGKKKLLIIIVAAVLVLAIGGVGALLLLKKKGHGDEDEADAAPAKQAVKVRDPSHPPVFSPLEPFTVNLADKDAERYAQIGITLELDEAKTGDTMKVFMPAVRNNVLMLLAHKSSAELLQRDGKEKLAKEVAREVSRAMGVEVDDEEDEDEEASSKKKRKKRRAAPELPVRAVYFSTFIIQ